MYLISKWLSALIQSAYRKKKHSTETALLYVTSAVKTAMDKKQGTILLGVATITASLCVQCLCVCIDRHLDMRSKCRKLSASMLALSTCERLIKLAAFSPDRQRNALSMPLSHHGLTTVMRSDTVRLQLTSPVYSEYKTWLQG